MYVLGVVFGIIQFALIGYILISELKRKSPAVLLWATLFIMFGFPHLLTVFLEDMNYSQTVILQASIFVCAFCLVYLICRTKKPFLYITLTEDKFEIDNTGIEESLFEYLCLFIFFISIVGFVVFIVNAQGGLFNTSWASARAVETNYVSVAGLANRLIFVFSGLSLFYFLTKRRIKSVIVLALFLGLVVITRNRVQVIPVFVFFVSLYLLKIRTIRIKHIMGGIALAIIVIYLVYAIRAFRFLGTLQNAVDRFSLDYINATVKDFISSRDGELGLRQYFYYFIENDNEFEGFNHGYTYIRMLLVYLPSQWSLGLKPQGFDLYMGQAVGMASGGSMHPTLFGDCFGNMWWFGIFLGGFWAWLANLNDDLISRKADVFSKIMIFFLSSYSFVVIGRGSVYNGFEVYAWGVLILLIMKSALKKTMHKRVKIGNIKLYKDNVNDNN